MARQWVPAANGCLSKHRGRSADCHRYADLCTEGSLQINNEFGRVEGCPCGQGSECLSFCLPFISPKKWRVRDIACKIGDRCP